MQQESVRPTSVVSSSNGGSSAHRVAVDAISIPVSLHSLFESPQWKESPGRLPLALGADSFGHPVVEDLASMQHLLIGGSDVNEKDAMLLNVISSLACCRKRDFLRLAIIGTTDVLEDGRPSMLPKPIAPSASISLWEYLLDEMMRRNSVLASEDGQTFGDERFPYIVVIVGELAAFPSAFRDPVKEYITRVARFGHHVGIHLILATIEPTRRVIRSSIKANIPARIAFKCPSPSESRVIIDLSGAEFLSGRGDALFTNPETSETTPIQTPVSSIDQMQSATGGSLAVNSPLWLTGYEIAG